MTEAYDEWGYRVNVATPRIAKDYEANTGFEACHLFVTLMRDKAVKRMFHHTMEDLLPNDLKWDALMDILSDTYSEWCDGYADMMNDHQRDY